MSQRRSYPNSGDFNLDDLFRPEPGQQQGPPQGQPPVQPGPQPGHPQQGHPQAGHPQAAPSPGQPEYLGDSALPTQAIPAQPGAWGGAPQPGYPGAPQSDPAPATQYLPPYPAGGPPQGGGYPAAQPGFATQPTQAFPQVEQGYQGYPPAVQEYPGQERQDYPAQAAPGGRGGRSSTKLVVGGVVAGCLAAAVLVAVLMDKDEPKSQEPKAAPAVTGSGTPAATPTAGASTATVSPEVKAQAQALSDLLGTANDSRQAVIGAVGSVQKCEKLPESQQALTAAAGQRRELQTKLAALKTDKLPSGQQLVEQLNAAWTASATADDEYAAWAGDAQGGCEPKKTDNQHYKNAVQSSGTATNAKKQAAGLWNTVAGQTGLPTRTDGDL
ncbi:hypothetical protein [Kitasatospora sp. NBC_00458]|uniref:hypothetical protein n=1 Tax=Kitasatospora sp. NBC_00458 TaxID=2903568 RepID=UPI002E18A32C